MQEVTTRTFRCPLCNYSRLAYRDEEAPGSCPACGEGSGKRWKLEDIKPREYDIQVNQYFGEVSAPPPLETNHKEQG